MRSSGILLHITSLSGPYGMGDLGPAAYGFADFLQEARQTLWQVLPVVPSGHGYSPYSSPSTFAGSPLMISPDLLLDDGLLTSQDLAGAPSFPDSWIDFQRAIPFKRRLLEAAYDRFEALSDGPLLEAFDAFVQAESDWLADYALFEAIKESHGGAEWTQWPKDLAQRKASALEAARKTHARLVRMHAFWQFIFDQQWRSLKAYCNERSVRIFGDLPIYVAQDSADVWAAPELFHLDEDGRAVVVAGVPPDYFSETGQRWGNPIYRWDVMKQNDYRWWTRRMARILDLVDVVRLDHFRGFEAYWEVPAAEETAINGRWVDGPGADLFERLEAHLGTLSVVAENLGVITEGVTGLMERFGFPGMAILQFAFDSGPENEFLPHNYTKDLVAYTGTHDNDTFVGWWTNTQSTQDAEVIAQAHRYCREYLEIDRFGEPELHTRAIRALMLSAADTVVHPLQDVLGYGSDARMNTPGLAEGNWGWRATPGAVGSEDAKKLRTLTELSGRA